MKIVSAIIVFFALIIGGYFYLSSTTNDLAVEDINDHTHDKEEHAQITTHLKKTNNKSIVSYKDIDIRIVNGEEYVISRDCYIEVLRDIYEDLTLRDSSYNWLSSRGYIDAYDKGKNKSYHHYKTSDLKSLALNNADPFAMLRLGATEGIYNKNYDDAVYWYEMAIVHGDFRTIDPIIHLYEMRATEAKDSSTRDKMNQEAEKWLAFKKEVNGFDLFSYREESDLTKWNSWANQKLEQINTKRSAKHLPPLNIDEIPNFDRSILPAALKYIKEQQRAHPTICPYW